MHKCAFPYRNQSIIKKFDKPIPRSDLSVWMDRALRFASNKLRQTGQYSLRKHFEETFLQRTESPYSLHWRYSPLTRLHRCRVTSSKFDHFIVRQQQVIMRYRCLFGIAEFVTADLRRSGLEALPLQIFLHGLAFSRLLSRVCLRRSIFISCRKLRRISSTG